MNYYNNNNNQSNNNLNSYSANINNRMSNGTNNSRSDTIPPSFNCMIQNHWIKVQYYILKE